ncbi:MAG: dihydropteroate synthase [Thermoplasmata archaeon]|nr:MAG: dihydropteroate synthase [Thermoplasmata archaeon]
MGILNVTPDSFSDGGRFFSLDSAVAQAHRMVDEGADIIDVGGESTRPSSGQVSTEEERKRVIPVIKRLLDEIKVPVSIDTYKPEIAEEALELGVHLVNDVNAFREAGMAEVVAKYDVPCVLMHFAGGPHNMVPDPQYENLMEDIKLFLFERIKAAEAAGIAKEKIILDPGIGFSKKKEHNLEILRKLGDLRTLGQPLLIGTSRKSFIGDVLERPPDERLYGTLASLVISIMHKVDFVRVHDVKEAFDAVRLADAVLR